MSIDFSKLTKTQIAQMNNRLAVLANAKLKEMRDLGYDKLNYSMVRKYNTLTSYEGNSSMITKKGYFRKGGASKVRKENLIKRYNLMNDFINNDYATVAYTQRHLEELRNKWSLTDDEVKDMFEAYREFGYNNYSDSEGVLQSFSKIMNDTPINANDQISSDDHLISNKLDNKGKTEADYVRELQNRAHIIPD